MAEIVAKTARLLLRTEAEGDQAIWHAHMNDAQVMACLGGPRTPDQIAEAFRCNADNLARHGQGYLLLERRADGLLVGQCGLSRIDTPVAPAPLRDALQIGWLLRADCWGRGYAREAAEAVRAMAFERHGAPVLYGQTSQSNPGSWRLMEKLGMTRRADLDYADPDYPPQDNPTMVYAQRRAAWRAREQEMAP